MTAEVSTAASTGSVYRSSTGRTVTVLGPKDRVRRSADSWGLRIGSGEGGDALPVLYLGLPASTPTPGKAPGPMGPVAIVLDPEDVDALLLCGRQSAAQAVRNITEWGHVFVLEREAFRLIAELAVKRASRVHLAADASFDLWLAAWTAFEEQASERVILNRRTACDAEQECFVPGMLVARDRLEDLTGREHNLSYWIPASADRREADGVVEPRQTAWHLTVAAGESAAALVVLDRAETAVYLARSSVAELDIALAITGGWDERLEALPTQERRRMIRTLTDSARIVLIGRGDDLRTASRRLGDRKLSMSLDLDNAFDLLRLPQMTLRIGPITTLPSECTLLIAGHDFKFLGELTGILGGVADLRLIYDKWPRQNANSVTDSEQLLDQAQVILCEFASQNAVWYSWHKRPGQRLIVRFHGYELFQDFVQDINIANVDVFVFVSEFYRDRVVSELGWPRERTTVVPNMIDAFDLERPKHVDARFHLGIAGIVPVLKRPDRALDLLEQLLAADDRYVLHIRGRSPWDYGWVWRSPVTQDAYLAFYERLAERPALLGHVSFDDFGPDMGQWFRRIGWMLSPSSRETFHLAPVEGMPSGTIPVVWDRVGAQEIFEERWVYSSTEEAARSIIDINRSDESLHEATERARGAGSRYDIPQIAPLWAAVLFGPGQSAPLVDERFDEQALRQRFLTLGTAAALERLIMVLLEQPHCLGSIRELEQEHPDLFRELSPSTRRRADELRIRETLHRGEVRRPPRAPGAAYLPEYGTAYIVEGAAHSETLESTGEIATSTRLIGLSSTGAPETLIDIPSETTALDSIQLIADAVTRRARVHRPQVIAVGTGLAMVSWGVLIAGRRLGVPVMTAELGDDHLRPPAEEFDGIVDSASGISAAAVEQAQSRYDHHTRTVPSIPLDRITMGLISDEFTERTVSERCAVVHIPREDAYLTVASERLDVLFVESAWTGRDGEWFHGVAYYKDSRQDIEQAIRVAKAKGVPVIFWNKEDPVHFKSFAPTAALCDVVFTTDADRIPAYLENAVDGDLPSVGSMPFYAEPRLHHPLPGAWEEKPTVSYAGTYYGQRYADRSAELERILAAAQIHGLTIYDRQKNHPNSPYSFPEKYDAAIAGGLSYDDVLEAYKAHPAHINVNSVNDSPTMFSRRVVEIAASGSVVVSGRGRGIAECLPAVPVSDNADELGAIMGSCLDSKAAWRSRAWSQLRAVRRSYLAEQALGIMLRAAGLPISLEPSTTWTAIAAEIDVSLARDLMSQTHRPRAVMVTGAVSSEAASLLEGAGIAIYEAVDTEWSTHWELGRSSTWAEDLLYAARFAPQDVDRIGARKPGLQEHGLMTWGQPDLPVVFHRRGAGKGRAISWLIDDDTSTEGSDRDGR